MIKPDSVDLVFLWRKLKEDNVDSLVDNLVSILNDAHRILKTTGTMYFLIEDFYDNSIAQTSLSTIETIIKDLTKFMHFSRVVWYRNYPTYYTKDYKIYAHQYILMLTKDNEKNYFNWKFLTFLKNGLIDKVEQALKIGRYINVHVDTKGYRNRLSLNGSKLNIERYKPIDNSIVDIIFDGNKLYWIRTSNLDVVTDQEEIIKILIQLSCPEEGVVCDLSSKKDTIEKLAKQLNRQYIEHEGKICQEK